MPALPLVAGDVLHRGASRLAGELGETHLVHAMPVSRIEADARMWPSRSIRPSMAAGLVAAGI